MKDCEKLVGGVWKFFLSGKEVTEEEYRKLYPPIDTTRGKLIDGNRPWTKPVISDGMAVHETQIPEAVEHDRAHGVPTDYTPDGRPIFRSRDHRARYLRSYNVFDRDAGYSDPAAKVAQ